MGWIILAMMLAVLSAVSARFLLRAVTQAPARMPNREFTLLAQKVGRWYKIASWAVVTIFLLNTLFQLFWTAIHAVI